MSGGSAANMAPHDELRATSVDVRVTTFTTLASTVRIAPPRLVPAVAALARVATVAVVPVPREHALEALLDEIDDAIDESLLVPPLPVDATVAGLLGAASAWSSLALDRRNSALQVA